MAAVVAVLLVLAGCAASPQAADPATLLASGRLRPETAGHLQRLIDDALPTWDRRAAADALLRSSARDAVTALKSVLEHRSGEASGRLVAQAVTLNPTPPPDALFEPLLGMLRRADGELRSQVAPAFRRFEDERVYRTLAEMAGEAEAPLRHRRAAIEALAHFRTKKAAEQLIELTGPDHPAAVQQSAFDALAELAAIKDYENDRAAWLDWWDRARKFNDQQWSAALMENVSRREAAQDVRAQELEQQLINSKRAHYRSVAPEDRPPVLAYMLRDKEPVIRQLAMDLAQERLVEGLNFGDPLREALRSRLVDSSSDIRTAATEILLQLADEAAADIVARRLAVGEETVTGVLRASLIMMSRMPRAAAVEPALDLLQTEALRGDAAGALAAMAEHGLMTDKQAEAAARVVRRRLEDGELARPEEVMLLGRVGDEQAWRRIAGWVDSSDPAIKRAAAQAWADSHQPLELLARRVSDPLIEPIVIIAAIARGDDPFTMLSLAAHLPQREQVADAWRRALVAMARRVPPDTVLEAVRKLREQAVAGAIVEQVLTAAIERANGDGVDAVNVSDAARGRLLLYRAEERLRQNEPGQAVQDYVQGFAFEQVLAPSERDRLYRGRIRAHLALNEIEPAFDIAERLLAMPNRMGAVPATDDPLVDQFLDLARSNAGRGRPADAKRVLTKLRLLLGGTIKPEVAQRIALLEAELTGVAEGGEPRRESTTASPQPPIPDIP